jgi:hypothetical protein
MPEIEFTTPMNSTTEANVPALPPNPALPAPVQPATMLDIIDRASRDPSVDIDKLERLIGMKERMEAKAQQVDFDNAMADAQEAMKAIRADLFNKQTQSNYASYAQLDKATRPIYAAHGFSLSFDTEAAPDNYVRIVCTVAHRSGHRERRQIDMPADGKGAKGGDVMTKTHATGAAASYGQRYLLKLIFNLAVGDVDDDGNGAGGDGLNYDADIEANAPKNALRDTNGKLLSTYKTEVVKKAQKLADDAIQSLNLSTNAVDIQRWRNWAETAEKKNGKSPLDWLRDNSPGQYTRVRQAYQNAAGEDLE